MKKEVPPPARKCGICFDCEKGRPCPIADPLPNGDFTIQPIPLSRRDCLAAMAMNGILQNSKGLLTLAKVAEKRGILSPQVVAETAIEFADALLAELDRSPSDHD